MSTSIEYAIGLFLGLVPLIIVCLVLACMMWYGLRDLRRALQLYQLSDSVRYQESLLKQRLTASFYNMSAVWARKALKSNWMESSRNLHVQSRHSKARSWGNMATDHQKQHLVTGQR